MAWLLIQELVLQPCYTNCAIMRIMVMPVVQNSKGIKGVISVIRVISEIRVMQWQFTLDTIKQTASEFWKAIDEKKVIAFHGEMGSGKTTFIHALCDIKNVKEAVSSPTFSIINEYSYDCNGTPRLILHMDLFRIDSDDEARRAGVEDALYSGNTCFVEWPDKAASLFPPGTLHVVLDTINTDTRQLRINDN